MDRSCKNNTRQQNTINTPTFISTKSHSPYSSPQSNNLNTMPLYWVNPYTSPLAQQISVLTIKKIRGAAMNNTAGQSKLVQAWPGITKFLMFLSYNVSQGVNLYNSSEVLWEVFIILIIDDVVLLYFITSWMYPTHQFDLNFYFSLISELRYWFAHPFQDESYLSYPYYFFSSS